MPSTACSASPTPSPVDAPDSRGAGGEDGRKKQKTAARKYRPATTTITASGDAMLTTSGPSRANPIANEALRVRVKIPLADRSCLRSTTKGIIAASAGAKKTVTVEIAKLSSRISGEVRRRRGRGATNAAPRSTLVTTRMIRRSMRST